MEAKIMRHFQVTATKSLFDELIDRHAEAYLEAYPEVKEFSNFEKSGTGHYYIGMIWESDFEKPDPTSIKLRGSMSIASNALVELDLSFIDTQQSFFPGQIIAFLADPFTKRQLTIRRLLDPMAIAPRLKTISTNNEIRLLVAAGPYMKPEEDDWSLLDKIVEAVREHNANHVILIGPFVDLENKFIRSKYDVNWKQCIDTLFSRLHDHECRLYLVPSGRDVLPHDMSATYFYPSPPLDFDVRYREGIVPKCQIKSVSDPSQIDLEESIFVDVTSAEVLLHLNKSSTFINKQQGGQAFNSMYRHLLSLGIYPIYPPPNDIAVDYPRLAKYIQLDRLAPHILLVPTRFNSSVVPVDNRLVIAVKRCSATKQAMLVTIPKIDGSSDTPVNSVVDSKYEHKIIDLCPKAVESPQDVTIRSEPDKNEVENTSPPEASTTPAPIAIESS